MGKDWLTAAVTNLVDPKCSSHSDSSVVTYYLTGSVTSKKSPNVNKSCPKMISQEKLKILTPLQKIA